MSAFNVIVFHTVDSPATNSLLAVCWIGYFG